MPQVPGTPPDCKQLADAFERLVAVVARLRAPDGCPWDREQTLKTIEPYTLEETYEVLEAIDADDDTAITEELGDLLLQVVLYAQIAADEGRFDLIPVVNGITEKLIRRHPHVFGEDQAHTAEHVLRNWEQVKATRKAARVSTRRGPFSSAGIGAFCSPAVQSGEGGIRVAAARRAVGQAARRDQ
jgi:tetrapyrrole methylase family protein / MazG family protein